MPVNYSHAKSLTVIVIALFCSINAAAETSITKSISYFTIEGKTADELDAALERQGPQSNQSGARHPGITRIDFGGEVTFTSTDAKCSIDRVNVTLSTRIELPRWRNRKRAEENLGITWDAISSDIKRHEERHAEIAKQHADKLDKALTALAPSKTCDALQRKVSQATQKIMRQHDSEQARFDRVEAINFEKRFERIINQRK